MKKIMMRRFKGEGAKTNLMNAALLIAGKDHKSPSGKITIKNGRMIRHGAMIVSATPKELSFRVPSFHSGKIDRVAVNKINAVLQQGWTNRLEIRNGNTVIMDDQFGVQILIEPNAEYRMM